MNRFMPWLGIGTSKFYDWRARFGKVNEHNAWVPRDHWLTDQEKESDLWAHATRQTPYDAALDLCQRLNIPVPILSSTQQKRNP
jgi:hypothetical protein